MISVKNALELIQTNKKVAIVGLSPKEDRPSYKVGVFLKGEGFEITPIHPKHDAILGYAAKPSLSELQPGDVDWIDLFLNPERLMDLLDDIKRLQPKLVWCQIGVVNDAFNQALDEAGIAYIADVCPKIEWSRHG